jgi:hypothetical protein
MEAKGRKRKYPELEVEPGEAGLDSVVVPKKVLKAGPPPSKCTLTIISMNFR